MKRIAQRALLGLAACVLAHGQPQSDVYRNAAAGLEFTKPASWSYLSAREISTAIQEILPKGASVGPIGGAYGPLVSATKYKEPYPKLNPTVTLYRLPAGEFRGRPTEFLKTFVPRLQATLKTLKVTREPEPSDFDGHNGAYVQLAGFIHTGLGETAVIDEMWIVPRGGDFILIEVGTPWENNPGLREEIAAVVNSVRIGQ